MCDLFLIALICSFCIGYSGFIDSLEEYGKKVWGRFFHIPKPFSCELCSTFWLCIIYLIVTGHFTLLWIAVSCLAAASTKVIVPLIHLTVDFINNLINSIYQYFGL